MILSMWYVGLSQWDAGISQRVATILEPCEIPWLALEHAGRAALELDEDDERVALLVAALLTAHGLPAERVASVDRFLEWNRTYYIGIPEMTAEQGEAFVATMREGGIPASSTVADGLLILTVQDHEVATEFVRSYPVEEQRTVIMEHVEAHFWNRVRALKRHGN